MTVASAASTGFATSVRASGRQLGARRTFGVAVVAGLALMAFSTPPSTAGFGTVVVPIGLPVLALVAASWFYRWIPAVVTEAVRIQGAVPGLLLLLTSVIPALWAPAPLESGARALVNVVGYVLFLGASHERHRGGGRGSERRLRSGLILMAFLTAVQYLFVIGNGIRTRGFDVLGDRVVGGAAALTWGASNNLASIFVPGFLLSLGTPRGTDRRRTSRFARPLMSLIVLAGVLATLSRGGILSLVAGLLWLSVVGHVGWKRRIIVIVLVGSTGAIAASMLFGNRAASNILIDLAPRLSGRWQEYSDLETMSSERLPIYEKTIEKWKDRPILGYGYYGAIYTLQNSGHNWLLTTLLERGVMGVILAMPLVVSLLIAMVYWRALRKRAPGGRAEDAENAALVAMAVHLLVEDTNFIYPHIVFSWVLFGLVLGRPLAPVWTREEERRAAQ